MCIIFCGLSIKLRASTRPILLNSKSNDHKFYLVVIRTIFKYNSQLYYEEKRLQNYYFFKLINNENSIWL